MAAQVGDPLDFFIVAATVIPVLYATAVFEARTLEQDEDDDEKLPTVLLAVVVTFFALAGEIAALHVLAKGHPTRAARHLTWFALGFLGVSIAVGPIAKAFAPLVNGSPNKIGAMTLGILALGGLALFVGITAS